MYDLIYIHTYMYMKITPFCIVIFVLFTVMRKILFYNYII